MVSNVTTFLEQLGLTEYEAKVMDALFKLNESFAPQISRNAQVPKTRVYDVLDRLVEKKLIIEIYGRPKKYKVIPPEKAFTTLIEERKKELFELDDKSNQVLKELNSLKKPDALTEKVMKVKSEHDFIKILNQEIEQAKDSVTGFTKLTDKHTALRDALRVASNKKLQVKLLHSIADKNLLKELTSNGAEVKSFEHELNAYIIDGKKVILALTDFDKNLPEYHFSVWNNSKQMADVLQNYFENCWKKGK